jgi:Fe-S-cluster-containing dehydrogenase component
VNILVNAEFCRDCEACALACSLLHEGKSNPLLSRILVRKDMESYKFDLVICQHCSTDGEDPDCVQACSIEAIYLDERGIVVINQDECIQCAACADACTYNAIFYNPEINQYYKCEFCVSFDSKPACVEICPVKALVINLEAEK